MDANKTNYLESLAIYQGNLFKAKFNARGRLFDDRMKEKHAFYQTTAKNHKARFHESDLINKKIFLCFNMYKNFFSKTEC